MEELEMRIGLQPGEKGVDVERLHRVLVSTGLRIEHEEIERSEFGPSTLDALHSLERQRGLPALDRIDASTFAALVEIEQNLTTNVNEGNSPGKPPAQIENQGIVRGKLVDEDGAPRTM